MEAEPAVEAEPETEAWVVVSQWVTGAFVRLSDKVGKLTSAEADGSVRVEWADGTTADGPCSRAYSWHRSLFLRPQKKPVLRSVDVDRAQRWTWRSCSWRRKRTGTGHAAQSPLPHGRTVRVCTRRPHLRGQHCALVWGNLSGHSITFAVAASVGMPLAGRGVEEKIRLARIRELRAKADDDANTAGVISVSSADAVAEKEDSEGAAAVVVAVSSADAAAEKEGNEGAAAADVAVSSADAAAEKEENERAADAAAAEADAEAAAEAAATAATVAEAAAAEVAAAKKAEEEAAGAAAAAAEELRLRRIRELRASSQAEEAKEAAAAAEEAAKARATDASSQSEAAPAAASTPGARAGATATPKPTATLSPETIQVCALATLRTAPLLQSARHLPSLAERVKAFSPLPSSPFCPCAWQHLAKLATIFGNGAKVNTSGADLAVKGNTVSGKDYRVVVTGTSAPPPTRTELRSQCRAWRAPISRRVPRARQATA